MCVNINKACNVLCSQSLCDLVVSSCRRGVTVKVVGCVKICRVLFLQIAVSLSSLSAKATVNIIVGYRERIRDIYRYKGPCLFLLFCIVVTLQNRVILQYALYVPRMQELTKACAETF